MVGDLKENAIEFYKGDKRATVSFSQGKYISRIKKLKERFPDEVEIVAENPDGSLYAHIPTKWIKINPPKEMTDEQREAISERFSKYRAGNNE